jgi:hypothetical protein
MVVNYFGSEACDWWKISETGILSTMVMFLVRAELPHRSLLFQTIFFFNYIQNKEVKKSHVVIKLHISKSLVKVSNISCISSVTVLISWIGIYKRKRKKRKEITFLES